MAETVLVTGGTGFLGSWCIVELLKRGYAVRTTVRKRTKEVSVRKAVSSQVDPGDRLSVCIADLLRDEGWNDAAAGCDYVMHVASPLGDGKEEDPNALIEPARDGTLRVLRAAVRAGVKRVVVTSSVAASSSPLRGPDSVNDETVWTDLNAEKVNAYRQSKTIAERAAWDFMKAEGGSTNLTTVLPGAILGPILSSESLGSVQVVGRLLQGKLPGNPRLGFSVVDVRDVADLHILAMTAPEAAGERFIATSEYMWMTEISEILRAKLGDRAKKIPTRNLPDFLLRLASVFDPALKMVTPSLGRKHEAVSGKARKMLGWKPRAGAVTVVDCGESLFASGLV